MLLGWRNEDEMIGACSTATDEADAKRILYTQQMNESCHTGEWAQLILRCVISVECRKSNGEVNISHETHNYGSVDLWWYLIAKNNYMFRPIAAIFMLLQFCSKSIIYMSILRGDAEISSSLRVTISLFSGKSNGQWLVGCKFYG